MAAEPTFDLDKFRRLLDEGLSADDAATACGVAASGLHTLLRRRGYRLRRVKLLEPLVVEPIPASQEAQR